MIKKILSILAITFLISGFFIQKASANIQKQRYFVVTAYYSPLPNQSHYIMGTYAKELRMNGKGIRGASGKKVFPGMLAAPSIYTFGTKIKLEGVGIGEVADRGGAIVKAGVRSFKYDRIDIWMGHGEKGLQRAMHWGTRTIKGSIIPKNNKVNLPLSKLPAPRWTIYHATKNPDLVQKLEVKNKVYLNRKVPVPKVKKFISGTGTEINIFSGPITNSTGVKKLQNILKEMKLYSGEINGEYSSIRGIVLEFQLKNNVISKKTNIGAGHFGPKTRKTLKQKYSDFKEKVKKEEENKIKKEKEEKQARIKAEKRIQNIGDIKIGDISHEVRQFQIVLKELGFFNHKDTAIFGEKTKQSIINYQLDRKLIKNKNIIGAGIFGPKTRKSLIEDLSKLK